MLHKYPNINCSIMDIFTKLLNKKNIIFNFIYISQLLSIPLDHHIN